MKIKLLMLALIMLSSGAVYAQDVTIKTSCGKTVILQSKDYINSSDMIEDAFAIDDAICGEVQPALDNGKTDDNTEEKIDDNN